MSAPGAAERLAAFEAVLADVQREYAATVARMEELKEAGRVKSATYRQLFARRMTLREMLTLFEVHGVVK